MDDPWWWFMLSMDARENVPSGAFLLVPSPRFIYDLLLFPISITMKGSGDRER
jgi:hypothetical protein